VTSVGKQLAVATKRDAAAALQGVQHDVEHKLKGVDSKLELHDSKLQTLADSLAATKGQVQEATLVADKLHDSVVERREEGRLLQQTVHAVESRTTAHDASIERVQGMVKEVVHVIGAMSARLTEQLGTSTDPQHAPPAVASKVDERFMSLYMSLYVLLCPYGPGAGALCPYMLCVTVLNSCPYMSLLALKMSLRGLICPHMS
jgi:hypothetical protein